MRVIVIGGVAGGMSAATRLRRLDESAEIIVLEKSSWGFAILALTEAPPARCTTKSGVPCNNRNRVKLNLEISPSNQAERLDSFMAFFQ